jgi:AcrR family transcriptional regulator
LLDSAERLFGEHGVFNASLRQIRIESGARNTAAIHHYFTDREGLILGLTERHLPRIAERQRNMWEAMVERGSTANPRELAELLVRPCAEYLERGASERSWIKIMAELGSRPDVRWHEAVELTPTAGREGAARLFDMVEAIVPPRIARERMFVGARMSLNVCADRVRRIESPVERGEPLPIETFVDNVSNMLCGALLAPLRDDRSVTPP